ncbi:YebG family protein [Shewanella sp.]|uniref:YebG family protein n=1 Tax=Shewanella sp. TaxID=50422 RepID=UPI00405473CA
MAVVTQFVVVREGVEKMTFTSKKEADAFDKMLDIADNLIPFLLESPLALDEAQCEQLAFYMAKQKDALTGLLKGASPVVASSKPLAVKKPAKKVSDKES